MQFVLTGFNEVQGSRVFAFEGVAADRSRTPYTVTTNLAMSRQYGIRLQELPLLCRSVLEQGYEATEDHAFHYAEADMSRYAECAAARLDAAHRRKAPRRPLTDHAGEAWRNPTR
ncbi:hypothetical protein [uncultured Paludibaculum sp.]|uniref:hypothetical protein n=1 Tax=uncultured Paludibaculum sp. TaxID=1765020 RepID=UPI002AAB3D5B|nr:hypothetical protein [uncultured Paludibaculum sp.]